MRSVLRHPPPQLLALALCISIAGCGCNTTPPPAAAPVQPPGQVALAWRDALVTNNPDAAMQLVSDDFSSATWPTRTDLANYLNTASSRGFFDAATPLPDQPTETPTNSTIEIYPISLRAAMGTAVFRLTLQQTNTQWKITSAQLEIY